MQLPMMLLISFSIFAAGCAGVERPDTDICIANAPAKHLKCYNMKRDYNDDGRLKKDAKPFFKPFSKIEDVNKFMLTDPEKGIPNLKAFINDMRDLCE